MLNIYIIDANGLEAPFTGASDSEQITLSAFTYNATRMGSAPTISATLLHPVCLDNFWTDGVYVKYKDERYFIKQIPTSSYSSEDIMYKHELEFVSERIALENVYFYDVVDAEFDDDKPVSNKSEFSFSGDIHQFAERLNQSLQYAGLDYRVEVDDGIESDDKLVTVENNFFSAVLQDIYNVYDLPYYFVGKVIHIGHSANAIDEVFSYGAENALLSVTKTNAGNRVINRVTGLGSEDNIPYYYPNLSPKGDIQAKAGDSNTGITDDDITIIDYEKYAENIALDGVISVSQGNISFDGYSVDYGRGKENYIIGNTFQIDKSVSPYSDVLIRVYVKITALKNKSNFGITPTLYVSTPNSTQPVTLSPTDAFIVYDGQTEDARAFLQKDGDKWEKYNLPIGTHEVCFIFSVGYLSDIGLYSCNYKQTYFLPQAFYYNDKILDIETVANSIYIRDCGLKITGTIADGDTFTQKLVRYINPQKNLMPPIYRQTDGAERFYNALNNTYQNPEEDEGIYYEFENPFVEGRPKEQIVQFDELKPTIKEVKNSEGLRIDMFSEFAYDLNDNDDLYTDDNNKTNYTHPYFFGKLRKLDFNLFDSAIDEGEMTIAMTSGNCGACEFIVGVDSETKENTVQVYEEDITDENGVLHKKGSLKRDENGNVLCGRQDLQNQVDTQPQQQDTINNEVWIALEKDNKTFGVLIPNVEEDYKPKACTKNDDGTYNNDGDTFVILHINLPQLYIEKAEEDLYDQIIRFMYDNNFEKFNFSIKFSRIYLAEHPEILAVLDENARIKILYNGQEHLLYVSSFTYKVTDSEILPEITVELKDNLAVSQNAIQRAVNKAVVDVYKTIGNIDVVAQANEHFLRSDQPDVAYQQITFDKTAVLNNGATVKNGGIKSDDFYSDIRGLAIRKDDDGNWHIETDYLKARKKFSAKEVEIQKVYHIGGAQIKSSANMLCSRVEDAGDAYRCYMETTDDSGNTIYNQFVVGDQAYVQTFNLITDENGDTTNHFYWRLVTGVGDNFILLSKTDCADGSTIPMVGDNIVQLGNRDNENRQVAVIDAGAGEGAPYYRQFVGINSFSLPEPETQLKPNDNVLTGRVHIQAGSTGIENLEGLPEIVQEAVTGIEVGGQNLLRNSGFTGDYLSEQLADDSVLDATNEMFNPLNVHWELQEATIQDSTESASGKEVLIVGGGGISQMLTFALIPNETYVFSFKAKGDELTYSIGGVVKTLLLTNEWAKYKETITIVSKSTSFVIQDASCTICELQLERGTIATAWSNSPFDNSSDRAYYQSLKYLNQALNESSTDILGGLVLTSHIKVGDYADKEMIKETGGMQGTWASDDSPFLWGGGTHEQALDTIDKYKEKTPQQLTDEELANMAKFVVTHGGRAILNDIILRGYIYALGGVFNGTIYAKGGTFDGRLQMPFVNITNYPSTGRITSINIGNETYERYIVPLLPSYSSHINASILYDQPYILGLPNSLDFDGWVLNVYCAPRFSQMEEITGVVAIDTSTNDITSQYYGHIFSSQIMNKDGFAQPLRAIMCPSGGTIQLVCVGGQWQVTNYIHNIQYLI